ncbi:hypothetical protein ONO86_05557 [Micromonospora noduli]|nr:hypothetical protein ONO86_05557 [Micromonospora noduli]
MKSLRTATGSGSGRHVAAQVNRSMREHIRSSRQALADLHGAPGRIRTCDTRFKKAAAAVSALWPPPARLGRPPPLHVKIIARTLHVHEALRTPEDGRRPPAGRSASHLPLYCKDDDQFRLASVVAAGLLILSPTVDLGLDPSAGLAYEWADKPRPLRPERDHAAPVGVAGYGFFPLSTRVLPVLAVLEQRLPVVLLPPACPWVTASGQTSRACPAERRSSTPRREPPARCRESVGPNSSGTPDWRRLPSH